MLYREIITVCSEIHTKHINTLNGLNVELLNVKLAVIRKISLRLNLRLFCWFSLFYARLEDFLAVLLTIRVFRVVTLCCRVDGSRRFETTWYVHLQKPCSPRLLGSNSTQYCVTSQST